MLVIFGEILGPTEFWERVGPARSQMTEIQNSDGNL